MYFLPISNIIFPKEEIFLIMKYISVEEAGKKFDLSARSIRNYCAQGRIPGAVLSGKTWLIPSDANKPERINSKEDNNDNIFYGESLISFINESPCSFVAIDNVKKELIKNRYSYISENKKHVFNPGDKVIFTRNDSSLIAINIGKNVNAGNISFHIIASHADSPCFKIKPECDSIAEKYSKIKVAPYGGLIVSTWLDRPLGVAGRVLVNKDNKIESYIVNLSEFTAMIPNLCIHFNRDINKGYEYNAEIDLQPFYDLDSSNKSLKTAISKKLRINVDQISNFDLYLYNKESGLVWGEKKEFVSSPRLDDLECVYTSMRAFIESENDNSINVLYIADNEEVGSLSRQGADSDFLVSIMKRVCSSLEGEYEVAVANSFLVSADNAHAVHPNKPEVYDKDNRVYLNCGIAIKFNASNTYTSDALSSAIFQKICENASSPYQFFTNRSDIRGGSTLGNYVLSHVSMMAVDIGLGQLAMHSSYETAGTTDIKYAINAFKKFYSSKIEIEGNTYSITE